MKIQRMLGDGVTWADVTNVAPLLDKVLEREPWYAPRRGRTPMTTHAEVAASAAVQQAIPALADLASHIGDRQVRNRGTIGGSLANNDPAACYPAAVLGLGATVHTNQRDIAAERRHRHRLGRQRRQGDAGAVDRHQELYAFGPPSDVNTTEVLIRSCAEPVGDSEHPT